MDVICEYEVINIRTSEKRNYLLPLLSQLLLLLQAYTFGMGPHKIYVLLKSGLLVGLSAFQLAD